MTAMQFPAVDEAQKLLQPFSYNHGKSLFAVGWDTRRVKPEVRDRSAKEVCCLQPHRMHLPSQFYRSSIPRPTHFFSFILARRYRCECDVVPARRGAIARFILAVCIARQRTHNHEYSLEPGTTGIACRRHSYFAHAAPLEFYCGDLLDHHWPDRTFWRRRVSDTLKSRAGTA